MPLHGSGWQPQHFKRFVRAFGSALNTTLIETEMGPGYLKGLGNREGPHALVCELIGTNSAQWLGLPTLDYALLFVKPDDEIPTSPTTSVASGPAFITRSEELAFPWGGDAETLNQLSNSDVISQLVVVDTWLRNCDRCSPDRMRRNRDNVLFVKEPASRRAIRLLAMDFTHAFTCGGEVTHRIRNIEYVNDARVYGMFPEFIPWMSRAIVKLCAVRLGALTANEVRGLIEMVPREWEMSDQVKSALGSFLLGRAHFLAQHVEEIIWNQMQLL